MVIEVQPPRFKVKDTVKGIRAPELPMGPTKGGLFATHSSSNFPLLNPAFLAPSNVFVPKALLGKESALEPASQSLFPR